MGYPQSGNTYVESLVVIQRLISNSCLVYYSVCRSVEHQSGRSKYKTGVVSFLLCMTYHADITLTYFCIYNEFVTPILSLCQRLGLTRSVRNKPRARSASIERRRRESPPEGKDERSESFAGGARGFAKQTDLFIMRALTHK